MSSRADGVSRSSGEHDEAIRQLIAVGEEKGYLHRKEIDTVLPPEITASSVLDDLLSQCRDAGIDVDSESLQRAGTRRTRLDADGIDGAARDFLAGMTDRFAVSLFASLFIPTPWVARG